METAATHHQPPPEDMPVANCIWALMLKHEMNGTGLFGIAAIAAGAITKNDELSIMGGSLVGGVLGGFCGARLSGKNVTVRELGWRWVTNCFAGIPLSLVLTPSYLPQYPDIPPAFLAVFFSAICGPAAVVLIPILGPSIIAGLRRYIGKLFGNNNTPPNT